MEKMAGEKRIETNNAVAGVIADIKRAEGSFGINILSQPQSMSYDETDATFNHSRRNVLSYIDLDNNIIESDDDENVQSETEVQGGSAVEVKTDIDELPSQKRNAFTLLEDMQLSNGIKKFGRGKWADILKDGAEVFHVIRSTDTLRMRAQTQGFKRKYNC